jgi:hypothetical protein
MWAPGQECFRSFRIAVSRSMRSQLDGIKNEGILFEAHAVCAKRFRSKASPAPLAGVP